MSTLITLDRLEPEQGYCYLCEVPGPLGDTPEHPARSRLEIFEDGRSLGPAHTAHAIIRSVGRGCYSHWHNAVYFSTSDNTDPRENGHHYQAYVLDGSDDGYRARLHALTLGADDRMSPEAAYNLAEALFYEAFPSGFIGDDGKLCWEEAEFIADYRRLVGENRRSFERKYALAELVKAVKNIPGHLAECGVYNGASAYFMAQASLAVLRPRFLHLFDSFEGLSAPGEHDGTYWRQGDLAISEERAREVLADVDGVTFYRGWIPQRFHEVADRMFAFVHIDVDLEQPTSDSLAFFYPRVSPGGVIVCDDYGFVRSPGTTRAFNRYMRDKPEPIVHLPTGQGVIFRASPARNWWTALRPGHGEERHG